MISLTDIKTEYWRKPIPADKYDWSAWEDGKEEEGVIGYGPTEDAAIEDLLEKIDEEL